MKYALFITLFAGLLFASGVQAADVTFDCDGSGCDISPSGALFNKSDMIPGDTVAKSIALSNTRTTDCEVLLSVDAGEQEGNSLASKLFVSIADGVSAFYGSSSSGSATGDKTLDDLLNLGTPVSLGVVLANSTKNVDWLVTFDPSTGNSYQGVSTDFDFDITAECADGSVAGSGDEQDCCPGPDPGLPPGPPDVGGQVLGASTVSGGVVSGATASKDGFAPTGNSRFWLRILALVLAIPAFAWFLLQWIKSLNLRKFS